MKHTTLLAALIGAGLCIFGCASPAGYAEDFKWSVDCPKSVDKGAEFTLVVHTLNAADQPVDGVKYHFQIMYTGGSSQPLRHKAHSGEVAKVKAHLAPGPATIVFTSENRTGVQVKVLETTFEVK
jgi:hypothetical protein